MCLLTLQGNALLWFQFVLGWVQQNSNFGSSDHRLIGLLPFIDFWEVSSQSNYDMCEMGPDCTVYLAITARLPATTQKVIIILLTFNTLVKKNPYRFSIWNHCWKAQNHSFVPKISGVTLLMPQQVEYINGCTWRLQRFPMTFSIATVVKTFCLSWHKKLIIYPDFYRPVV